MTPGNPAVVGRYSLSKPLIPAAVPAVALMATLSFFAAFHVWLPDAIGDERNFPSPPFNFAATGSPAEHTW
jgi:hypothetical protein